MNTSFVRHFVNRGISVCSSILKCSSISIVFVIQLCSNHEHWLGLISKRFIPIPDSNSTPSPDSYVEKKVEKFLHVIPIGVALIGAITMLSMDAFDPNMTYCFIGSDPQCEGERCEGASRNAKILFVVFSAGLYFILPCVIIISMAFV